MSINRMLGILAALTLLAVPAVALAAKPDDPGKGKGNSQLAKQKAKAYGKFCKNESRKHVKGTKGTPFSRCVNAAAKAANGASPKAACKGLSKKHVKGEKGTPYSRCIVAAAKAKKQQEPKETPGPTGPTGPTGTA